MLFENSRYVNSDVFLDQNNVKIFCTRPRQTFSTDKCTLYLFKAGDTLDSLAFKCYGDSAYYWAILDCNTKYMSVLDIKVGDHILIPDSDEVMKFYGKF
jgi:nucleoid-associated protein YgaU